MKIGFTTGSCAAAATSAAVSLLLSGEKRDIVTIMTPAGIEYRADVLDLTKEGETVSCAVKKDGGDDPDITTGLLIYATVRKISQGIEILGGDGIGIVTKPGLNPPVGEPAINSVPRQMIREAALAECSRAGYEKGLSITISAPGGEEIAAKTFNPRLGIEGGISIIGTSGIVKPMSNKALVDTIRVELNQRRALGLDHVVIAPGNYGADFMKTAYGYDIDKSVKCSNFIGKTIDMAREAGFKRLLLAGHIGKLIKIAGGILYTHSAESDCRMELLTACAIRAGAERDVAVKLLDCANTEAALDILKVYPYFKASMGLLMAKIIDKLKKRAGDDMRIDCIMYSSVLGELAKSEGVDKWFIL